jgi:hypothetical protein
MDRSLLFFLSGPNPQNKPDSQTGLSTTEYKVQFDVTNYDQNDPRQTTTEKKEVNYTLVNSLQNEGQFINFLGNSATNDFRPFTPNGEHESDIKLSSIIQWTQENRPALKLSAFHFAYLKNFNTYPANRIVALRRFNEAVPHDIMNVKSRAINTMISYYDMEKPFTLNFNEEWEDFSKGVYQLIQDIIGVQFASVGKEGGYFGDGIAGAIGGAAGTIEKVGANNLEQYFLQSIAHQMGLITQGDNIFGDPNIIYRSKIRSGSSGEDIGGSGLSCKFDYTFESTYVMLETNGIDAKAAMIDIIGNAVHMGTSNARFILTHNASEGLSKIIKEMENGNVEGLLSKVLDGLVEGMKKLGEGISNLISGVKKAFEDGGAEAGFAKAADTIQNEIQKALRDRFTRYKWQMRGAIGALSGMHTAPWHLTIGNPKCPWFTIGNIVVDSVDLKFGGEMAYNDMPSELTVTIKVSNGRPLGANEITSLFNNGRGRIYDTPEQIQKIYVPKGTAHNIGSDSNSSQLGNPTTSKNKSGISNQEQSNLNIDNDPAMNLDNTSTFSMGLSEGLDNNLGI